MSCAANTELPGRLLSLNRRATMQAKLSVKCGQCEKRLGEVSVDTADMPETLQEKVNKVILAHRQECRYYRAE
jgi:heterodisulfide reductase subunit A-like polyferredoxin